MIKTTENPTAKTAIILDTRRAKAKNEYPVKLRLTFERKQFYYPTPYNLTFENFEKIMFGKRLSEVEKNIKKGISDYENKATVILKEIPNFTWSIFEKLYNSNRLPKGNIEAAFQDYANELRENNRIGTAVSNECAKNSIKAFAPKAKFADITVDFLNKYEKWMLQNGKTKTTIGIYLRSLRAIFNKQGIDKSLYPFGVGNEKYSIPTGKNIKKALTLQEISKIFYYEAPPKTMAAMAKDYWIFSYLCNGLNVKDLCLLKHKNIQGDFMYYERAKTMRTKNDGTKISVSLKQQAKDIISKWGQLSINPETYVFPHLQKGMTAETERKVIQQVTKNINKYMKRIAKEQGINKNVTSYFARHSYSTVLRNSGASTEFISEALGHSNIKTTQSYLAGFEQETIHKITDALTNFA